MYKNDGYLTFDNIFLDFHTFTVKIKVFAFFLVPVVSPVGLNERIARLVYSKKPRTFQKIVL